MNRAKPIRKYLIGIDEAGRGPLAGPVAVGAVVFYAPSSCARRFRGVRDSKKLTPRARAEWFGLLQVARKEGILDFSVALIGAREIDERGIVPCLRRGVCRALLKLGASARRARVLLDGGLAAPVRFADQRTIPKGDEREAVIALASIAAKVRRDGIMRRYAKTFPYYGFERHKGYGTPAHYEALAKRGSCQLHRRTFLNPQIIDIASR